MAVAERLDTLSGGFVAGLKPTGNKDPFALRRNALGLIRTQVERGLDLDYKRLFVEAVDQALRGVWQAAPSDPDKIKDHLKGTGISFADAIDGNVAVRTPQFPDPAPIARELQDFLTDRLRGYYADQGVPNQQFESVVGLQPVSLLDFDRRVKAVAEFAKLPEAEALAAANKRSRNILKKVEGELPSAIDPALFNEPAERELAEAVDAAVADTDPLLAQRDYVAVLGRLARLRPQVDAFFDQVMVNVDDSAVRNNRLALLKRLSDRLGSVAAIEHLSI